MANLEIVLVAVVPASACFNKKYFTAVDWGRHRHLFAASCRAVAVVCCVGKG